MGDSNIQNWMKSICHGCVVKVGELHKLGCDVEVCPICGNQLITCSEEHFKLVEGGGYPRIPYIPRLSNCGVCGAISPDFFNVPDEEWDKYVIPQLQDKVLCKGCYKDMKKLFPNGWAVMEGYET